GRAARRSLSRADEHLRQTSRHARRNLSESHTTVPSPHRLSGTDTRDRARVGTVAGQGVAVVEVATIDRFLRGFRDVGPTTVTTEARWRSSPKAILSVLALSGVLSEVLSRDVLIDEPRRAGVWTRISATSSDPDEMLEVWLLDYGSFTEALLTLKANRGRVLGGTSELRRRLG